VKDSAADIIKTLDRTARLEDLLREAAARARVQPLHDDDVRHLLQVLTSQALAMTSVAEMLQLSELLEAHAHPTSLHLLDGGEPDAAAIHRALAVPDKARVVGDKCLFETGVARTRAPRGVDLEDLGRRSYVRAAHLLELLAADPRLARFYEQNALDRRTVSEDVAFLAHCADRFTEHVRLLQALLHDDPQPLSRCTALAVGSPAPLGLHAPAALPHDDAPPAARVPAPSASPSRARTPTPDLHMTSRTQEELAEETFRQLVALEKRVLFSVLDTELLRTELKAVVIHQDAAIDSLCDELCLYATGTQDPRKPASYFLVGPTGVGKNYLVESLLGLFRKLWNIEVPYLELEGPEFTYPSDINELKGAARGFIRSDEEGIMTKFHERAHDKPFSVILVDEVEKAHPQLRRFFLAVMDRGVMMDNRGRTLHFPNTMIFFTSNVGYSDVQRSGQPMGFGDAAHRDRAERATIDARIRKALSPEFVNRVHVIRFEHLTREAVDDIFDLEMEKVRARFSAAQGIAIDVTPAARRELIRRGYSRDHGARHLARALNRHVTVEISKLLRRDGAATPGDALSVLDMIREVRDGRRAMGVVDVRHAVEDVARARVPYRTVVVDFASGEIVHRTR
jgi:hypothetical protein